MDGRTQRTTVLLFFFSSHPETVNVIHSERAEPVARQRRAAARYFTPLLIRLSEGEVFAAGKMLGMKLREADANMESMSPQLRFRRYIHLLNKNINSRNSNFIPAHVQVIFQLNHTAAFYLVFISKEEIKKKKANIWKPQESAWSAATLAPLMEHRRHSGSY